MTALYTLTMALGALLLFTLQPMVAHILLPKLGGSAGVWTASMLFFQVALLVGYIVAHTFARFLRSAHWMALQLVALTLAAILLPFEVFELVPDTDEPTIWLLKVLTLHVAPSFILLSATSPTLQSWLSRTRHSQAKDPYFLYAASNAGSFVGLMAYPFLIEPFFGLRLQNQIWTAGFWVFALLVAGVVALSKPALTIQEFDVSAQKEHQPTTLLRAKWILFSAIPSSLLLGLTHYISTDLAAVPLLWVLPLGLYLLTFVFAFSNRVWKPSIGMKRALPAMAIALFATHWMGIPMETRLVAHLIVFFLISWTLHAELANSRPDPRWLTEFFLLTSIGGALGGFFNAFVGPAIFTRAIEYWFILAISCALMPTTSLRKLDALTQDPWQFAAPVLIAASGVLLLFQASFFVPQRAWIAIPALVVLTASTYFKPKAYAPALAILGLVACFQLTTTQGEVAAQRSFYGAYKVFDRPSPQGVVRRFSHGTTAHGAQLLDRPNLPVAYHHPEGPVGQILKAFEPSSETRVGVLGLGIGAMAAYAIEERPFTFYEIDPLVEAIARAHFSYLKDCSKNCTVKIGDGRHLIEKEPIEHFQLLFLDAYNSDSVPTHLMTREALQLYLSRVTDEGAVVFHVSNRYLNIRELVGALAHDARVACRAQTFRPPKQLRVQEFAMTSSFVIVSRDRQNLAALDDRWTECPRLDTIWTDDHANLLSIL